MRLEENIWRFPAFRSEFVAVDEAVIGNTSAHAVPGPLVGAGIPFIVVGYGAYWLVRRYRRKSPTPSA
jgi:hypothetical protein